MSIPTVQITTTIRDPSGAAVSGAKVSALLSSFDMYGGEYIYPTVIQATANGSGAVTLTLFPNALGAMGTYYRITAKSADGKKTYITTTVYVPNENSSLDDIAGTLPSSSEQIDAIDYILPITQGGTGARTAAGAAANLGLTIGTDVQAHDATLDALAGVSSAADTIPYFTGSDAASVTSLTSYARSLIAAASAAAARTVLGLGLLATVTAGSANQLTGMDAVGSGQEWKTLQGTSNQVSVTHGIGTITLSTPQSIGTASSPTFAGLTISGATASRLLATDGSKALASVSSLTSWIGGTANQVTVGDDGDGSVTLSLPQSIATGSSPTFASLTLNGPLTVTRNQAGASAAYITQQSATGYGLGIVPGADSGYEALYVNNSANSASNFGVFGSGRMYAKGRVSIGTATDNGVDALQVTGSGNFTGSVTAGASAGFSAGGIFIYEASSISRFGGSAATTRLYAASTGIVDLTASGIAVTGSGSYTSHLTLTSGQLRLTDGYDIRWGSSADTYIAGSATSHVIQFAANSAEVARIDSSSLAMASGKDITLAGGGRILANLGTWPSASFGSGSYRSYLGAPSGSNSILVLNSEGTSAAHRASYLFIGGGSTTGSTYMNGFYLLGGSTDGTDANEYLSLVTIGNGSTIANFTRSGTTLTGKLTAGGAIEEVTRFNGQNGVGSYSVWYDASSSVTRGYIGYGDTLFGSGGLTKFGIRSEGTLSLSAGGTNFTNISTAGVLSHAGEVQITKTQQALALISGSATGCYMLVMRNGAAQGYIGDADQLTSMGGDNLAIRSESSRLQIAVGGGTVRAVITSSSWMSLGTGSAPSYPLHFVLGSNSGDYVGWIENTTASNPYGFYFKYTNAAPNSSSSHFQYFSDSSTGRYYVRSDGGIGNYQANNVNLSDLSTKRDFKLYSDDEQLIANAWEFGKRMRSAWGRFKYLDQSHDDFNNGYGAQYVRTAADGLFPELVDELEWGKDSAGKPIMRLSVYDSDLMHLVGVNVTELQFRSEDHEEKIESLLAWKTKAEAALAAHNITIN